MMFTLKKNVLFMESIEQLYGMMQVTMIAGGNTGSMKINRLNILNQARGVLIGVAYVKSTEQETCAAIIEVTARCNLKCPICFAAIGEKNDTDPDLKTIHEKYQTLINAGGPYPVQLSGGEHHPAG